LAPLTQTRAIGVGMNQAEMLTRFVTDTDVDVILVAGRYTLLDQSADRELLPAARERGVPLRAAAARFPLRNAAVASVLIGARSAAEVADAVSLWQSEIPAALWDALAAEQPGL
jgi:D-threo-aldose 1-dehydrogenase